MEKKKKFTFKKLKDLESVEEKSFWLVTIVIMALGLASLLTSGSYESFFNPLFLVVLCLVIPGILVFVVVKTNAYHLAYPILCTVIGGISIPIMFIISGGFLSGMPLFCVLLTGVTALCYLPKWRYISFFLCLLGTSVAFFYVYKAGNLYLNPVMGGLRFVLAGTDDLYSNMKAVYYVYNDVAFTYYCASAGLFAVINFTTSDIRKYKINQDTLQQFFDIQKRKDILNKVLNTDISKASDHQKAAILFADISNFTSITEKMPTNLMVEYLNDFFSVLYKNVHENNGIIDKYIGDCAMIYWPEQKEGNCVLSAINAMIKTKKELRDKMEDIYSKYHTEINFSVGLSYGDVIFGDIGSNVMHDYTIIGDAVNVASRIQHSAVSGELLISESALEKVKNDIEFTLVEENHFFKGKNKPTDIYRVLGLKEGGTEVSLPTNDPDQYTLFIGGCRGSFPVSGIRFSEYGGETSCYVIKKDDYALIVDCGTGLKNVSEIIEGCTKIDILLTHLHYDHILGLLMIKFPKNAEIRIFGQFELWNQNYTSFRNFMEHPYWPIKIEDVSSVNVTVEKEITLPKNITATFYKSDHPDDTCIIKVMCDKKKVVFFADCENAESLDPEISKNSDILFFDGMFDDSEKEAHKGWGHGTWQDGVRFAKSQNIKKMVITHHNPESGDRTLKAQETKAREMSQNVSFAKSGDIFTF